MSIHSKRRVQRRKIRGWRVRLTKRGSHFWQGGFFVKTDYLYDGKPTYRFQNSSKFNSKVFNKRDKSPRSLYHVTYHRIRKMLGLQ